MSKEFQVNTYTENAQQNPAVAILNDGSYVVVWESYKQQGGCNSFSVYAQRFYSNGTKYQSEFIVDSNTCYYANTNPKITHLDNGGYVITWQSVINAAPGMLYLTYVKMFYNDNTPVYDQFNLIVNSTLPYNNSVFAISGGFLVTWEYTYFTGIEQGIYVEKFNLTQNQVINPTRVDYYLPFHPAPSTGFMHNPAIAAFNDSSYVVVWNYNDQSHDGTEEDVYGQKFFSNGTKVGDIFHINNYTYYNQQKPTIAALTNGNFVVAWEDHDTDSNLDVIYANVFDNKGNALFEEYQVSMYEGGRQSNPAVAALPNGGYIVTWESVDQDGSVEGIYANRFANDTTPGSEFRVNSNVCDAQKHPAIAVSNNSIIITWNSRNQDGSVEGVYAKVLPINPVFNQTSTFPTNDYAAIYGGSVTNNTQGLFPIFDSGMINVSSYVQPLTRAQTISDSAPFINGYSVFIWADVNQYCPYYEIKATIYDENHNLVIENYSLARLNAIQSLKVGTFNDNSMVVLWSMYAETDNNYHIMASYLRPTNNTVGNLLDIISYDGRFDLEVFPANKSILVSYIQNSTSLVAQKFEFGTNAFNNKYTVVRSLSNPYIMFDVEVAQDQSFDIVWSDGSAIYAQRYNANGSMLAGLVNITASPVSLKSDMFSDGSYVIAWNETNTTSQTSSIFARMFSNISQATGVKVAILSNNPLTTSFEQLHILNQTAFTTVLISDTDVIIESFLSNGQIFYYNSTYNNTLVPLVPSRYFNELARPGNPFKSVRGTLLVARVAFAVCTKSQYIAAACVVIIGALIYKMVSNDKPSSDTFLLSHPLQQPITISRKYYQFPVIAAHNAFCSRHNNYIIKNQDLSYEMLLKKGVRGFMLDIYYYTKNPNAPELIFQHQNSLPGIGWPWTGGPLLFSNFLVELKSFFQQQQTKNICDVVTLVIENYVTIQDIMSGLRYGGVDKYLSPVLNNDIQSMCNLNHRLVVFVENLKGDSAFGIHMNTEYKENHWELYDGTLSYQNIISQMDECKSRENRASYGDPSVKVFCFNHFPELLSAQIRNSNLINTKEHLHEHWQYCKNLVPNNLTSFFPTLIGLDFVDSGDILTCYNNRDCQASLFDSI